MVQAVIEMPVIEMPEIAMPAGEMAFDAPALRWEPCVEADATDDLGLCAGCGWPVDDHDGAPGTGPGVVVLRVPERLPLRRAS